jgi:hypothetical protein
MVYAVASETIRRFEFALGRPIRWRFRSGARDDPNRQKLRIFPHGVQAANAYYSRDLRALVLGYFSASETDAGGNLPGQTIFTCLSHDIIVHETTHAILDSLRMHFMDLTGPDMQAFHEAFADIVALFQHFTFHQALVDSIRRSGGMLHRPELAPAIQPQGGSGIRAEVATANPLIGLAQQFGEALGTRKALRSAIGSRADPQELKKYTEPHQRGAILVAAVFDAFFTAFFNRVRDLLSLARRAGWANGDLPADLAVRLAQDAARVASHFCNVCIRAIDYCPPVDMTFGDYLRALITADYELVPDDDRGYRPAIIDAFRARGIVPDGVRSYSEESLLWSRPGVETGAQAVRCPGLDFEPRRGQTARAKQAARNAVALSRFGSQNAKALGLVADVSVQAFSFHRLNRIGPDGQLKVQIVAELLQQKEELRDPNDRNSGATFRGGSTIVFDENGALCYAIHKALDSQTRLERWREFHRDLEDRSSLSAYGLWKPQTEIRFDLLHRGF